MKKKPVKNSKKISNDTQQYSVKFNEDYNHFNNLLKDICENIDKYCESLKILKNVATNLLWYGDKKCIKDGQPIKGIKNFKRKMLILEDVGMFQVDEILTGIKKLNKKILNENGK